MPRIQKGPEPNKSPMRGVVPAKALAQHFLLQGAAWIQVEFLLGSSGTISLSFRMGVSSEFWESVVAAPYPNFVCFEGAVFETAGHVEESKAGIVDPLDDGCRNFVRLYGPLNPE